MKNTGLVSISFRKLSPEEIIKAVSSSGLKYIEWGSDVHVPAGDSETAEKVARLMLENGLETSSYGSYYRLGDEDFSPYIATAKTLGAPIIRVWAGTKPSAEADTDYRKSCVMKAKEISDMAAAEGLKIAFEYHPGTLTDERKSALDFVRSIEKSNCGIYWQPNFALSHSENLLALRDVLPYVDIIHTFSWLPDHTRLKLSERADMWADFIGIAKEKQGIKYLLEFVKDDNPELLASEAKTLGELLK